MTHQTVTMSDATIHNPGEPRHFMRLKPMTRRIRILLGDLVLAESTNALRLLEVGKDVYDPVIYIPEADIKASLKPVAAYSTHCPLKGDTTYFDLTDRSGTILNEKIAWSYTSPLDFAQELTGHIAFRPDLTTIEDAPLA